jgi:hypothetical protein
MKFCWPFRRPSRRSAAFERDEQAGKLEEVRIREILALVKPYSMVSEQAMRFVCEQTVAVVRNGIAGAFVECGVWRGGSSIAMLLAQRAAFGKVEHPVYMLDSFEGLPPVAVRDGPLAARWQQGADPNNYFDNCRAPLGELQRTLDTLRFPPEDYRIVPGWFDQSVPALVPELRSRGIALLRLDGDWYGSTSTCLEHLVPLVTEGGLVIVDDYYAWDGCARAVHDYLSKHDLAYRLRSIPDWQGAYFMKKPHRDRFDVL